MTPYLALAFFTGCTPSPEIIGNVTRLPDATLALGGEPRPSLEARADGVWVAQALGHRALLRPDGAWLVGPDGSGVGVGARSERGFAGSQQTLGWCEPYAPDACGQRVERQAAPGLTEWWTVTDGVLRVGWTVVPASDHVRFPVDVPDADEVRVVAGQAELLVGGRTWVLERPRGATAAGRALESSWVLTEEGELLISASGPPGEGRWVIDPAVRPPLDVSDGIWSWDGLGYGTAPIGDFNGDGYGDFAVGADAEARIVFGSSEPAWDFAPFRVGYSNVSGLAGADLDADGFSDLILGQLSDGVDIWYGAATGTRGLVEMPSGGFGSGRSVAVGDFNGDSIPDVMTGTESILRGVGGFVDGWPGHAGIGPVGTDRFPRITPLGRTQSEYAATISATGDVNGDGYDDLVISEFGCGSRYGVDDGPASAYLHLGGPNGPGVDPVWQWSAPPDADPCDGYQTLIAPDIDGDGYDDLVVSGIADAWWLRGGPTGVSSGPMSLGEREPFCWYYCEPGWVWAAGLGDVNGDGYGDLGYGYASGIDVILGGPDGPLLTPVWQLPVDATSDHRRVFSVGDINADGLADILGTAPYEDVGALEAAGTAGLWLGQVVADIDQDGVDEPWDCEPHRPWAHPGAPEITGNTADDDCDGFLSCFTDGDGDGWGGATTALVSASYASCEAAGLYAAARDCWDANALLGPQATDLPENELDEDCDGYVVCYGDLDGDSYGSEQPVPIPGTACSTAPDRDLDQLDCDDDRASINPGAPELPSNIWDDDCDGTFGCAADADNDGYGSPDPGVMIVGCDPSCQGAAVVNNALDCDDTSAMNHPGVTDVTGDGLDNDCDGLLDCLLDLDEDGFGDWYGQDRGLPYQRWCDRYPHVSVGGDCGDGGAGTSPIAPEIPGDQRDANCDGFEDCALDSDGDGFVGLGDPTTPDVVAMTDNRGACPPPYVQNYGPDCNIHDQLINPGSRNWIFGGDANCDGYLECGLDLDGDGQGDAEGWALGLAAPCGRGDASWNLDDCDDTSPDIRLGGPEIVGDTVDQDCDGLLTCYLDADGDRWGEPTEVLVNAPRCTTPALHAADRVGDCGPTAPTVYPAARERPGNGVDDDCDGHDATWLTVSPLPPREGAPLTFQIVGARPGGRVGVVRSVLGPGAGPCPAALGGACVGVRSPVLISSTTADANGRARVTITAPAQIHPWAQIWFQALVPGAPGAATNVVSGF